MQAVRLNIFVGEHYYHTIKIPCWLFYPILRENEIKAYVEDKLPTLKSEKWRVSY